MKRFNLFLLASLFLGGLIVAQEAESQKEEFKPSGKAFGKVFWNYHYDVSEGAEQKNTFEVQRAYLGYKYSFSKDFSAKITLDGVRSVKDADGETLSPYVAQLKIAQLDWKVADPIKLSIGLIGLKQFDTQEKFWGYRYIYKSMQDAFKFGSSADLGVNAEIKIADPLKANVFVLNGEGYSNLQDEDGRIKAGGNLIYEPIKGLVIKGYYDIYGGNLSYDLNDSTPVTVTDTSLIQTVSLFGGYKTDKFRIGAEYNLQLNGTKYNGIAADHDLTGIAVYGTYVISKKFEVFANWMKFESNKLEGDTDTWNYKKDVDVILGGLQYAPVKGVKIALNYRTSIYDKVDKEESLVYVNFEYAF